MKDRLVAVTGGTGFVGKALLAALVAGGAHVRALARKIPAETDGIEWVQGDLANRAALERLTYGAEAVVHVAGLTTAPDAAAFEDANVGGTMAVLEAAGQAGVRRFVFVSSLAAREPSLSAYGASKARAERLVAASGLDWTTVRPPGVYGPWDVDYLEMFRMAKRGFVPVPPPGKSSLIHVTDLADLLVALVPASEATLHRIFEPDDGHAGGWSHRELARLIGWAVGRRPAVLHLPAGVLHLAAKADGLVRRRKARLTPDRAAYMAHPDWVARPECHVPQSVWTPRIPTRDGMKRTAEWYRAKGWL